jgi:osmotically inducible protein OsmC
MPTRNASAEWQGDFKRGGGTVAVGSGAFDLPYNFSGRFEDGDGTNPEELLGAAHASCFAMALSVGLTTAGHPPERLSAAAKVTIDQVEGGFEITRIDLTIRGKVPGVDADGFAQAAQGAKENCPLSKALAAVKEITLDAALEG